MLYKEGFDRGDYSILPRNMPHFHHRNIVAFFAFIGVKRAVGLLGLT